MRVMAVIILLLSMSTGADAGEAASGGATTRWMEPAASKPGPLILAQARAKTPKARRRLSAEQSFKVTKFINTCDAYAEFLRSYPDSRYTATARAWMQRRCPAKLVRDVPPAAAQDAVSQGSGGSQAPPPAAVRPKAEPLRQKQRSQRKAARKKRAAGSTAAARKPPVVRKKRSTVRRCRRETTLECIKRGGEFQFGQCDRQRVCD